MVVVFDLGVWPCLKQTNFLFEFLNTNKGKENLSQHTNCKKKLEFLEKAG